jgi:hypothetical protein
VQYAMLEGSLTLCYYNRVLVNCELYYLRVYKTPSPTHIGSVRCHTVRCRTCDNIFLLSSDTHILMPTGDSQYCVCPVKAILQLVIRSYYVLRIRISVTSNAVYGVLSDGKPRVCVALGVQRCAPLLVTLETTKKGISLLDMMVKP